MNEVDSVEQQRIESAFQKIVRILYEKRNKDGFWTGRLSDSALATAVASFALWKFDSCAYDAEVAAGLKWLARNQNTNGGWGDTVRSPSNLSTTLLCWGALSIVQADRQYAQTITEAEKWLSRQIGDLTPETIAKKVLSWYGSDQTFSVPILTMCCIAGRLGDRGWKDVPQLPFELAVFPDRFFKLLRLSVVSYAIPALIAIGLVRHRRKTTRNPFSKLLRACSTGRALRVLADKQASNGGFLEAAPLTSFVLMSLIEAGEKEHKVCSRAAAFLSSSIRQDGGWPIDTNLSTWVTTHAVKALDGEMVSETKKKTAIYLKSQQFKERHPFTKADPGGWAWTDLPGGIPDADDTSGALVALSLLEPAETSLEAAILGIRWLLDLQNSDGGLPTFCRGWGQLPFDKSCPDITAHALSAFSAWQTRLPGRLQKSLRNATTKAVSFLKKSQQTNGSWLPLWFGNESEPNHLNPVYGTSLVLCSLAALQDKGYQGIEPLIDKALQFLKSVRHRDGGFGGSSGISPSIEETSLAVRALAMAGRKDDAIFSALWLVDRLEACNFQPEPIPIGLYFASLWYFEELYPLVFAGTAFNSLFSRGMQAKPVKPVSKRN